MTIIDLLITILCICYTGIGFIIAMLLGVLDSKEQVKFLKPYHKITAILFWPFAMVWFIFTNEWKSE